VITAIGARKLVEAGLLGYTGPLTLEQAIEQGMITEREAKFYAECWRSHQPKQEEPVSSWPPVRDGKAAAGGDL
jgi:hypothetical protein